MTKWFEEVANDASNIVSSRVRLSRNWEEYKFPSRLEPDEARTMIARLKQNFRDLGDRDGQFYEYEDLELMEKLDRTALRERRLLNRTLAENQAKNGVDDGKLKEIASLDGDGEELLPDGNEVAAMPESAESAGAEVSGQETAAAGIENPGEAVLTGGTGISEYIAGVQLGREQIRAKNKETLMQIINSDQISEEEKQTAIQNLIGMTEISEKENAAETLLKAKGFVDPVVSITDGKVDVVVNAASLSDQERAQIEDIVKRKTEIGADGIVITLLDVDE